MSKVLVIGLDGGTYDILLPLMERGYLPRMKAMWQQGSWGRLASTIPPFTAAAWSTFATGQNPGQHGILSFQKQDRFHYHENIVGYVDSQQLGYTLWDILSEAGRQVVVVNVPVSYPPRPVNGLMITGMMTPKNATSYTFPAAVAEQLSGYRIDVEFIREGEEFRRYGLPSKASMLAEIQKVTTIRTQACLRLIGEQSWDFFMVVYTGTDRISHFFWDDLTRILLTQPPSKAESDIEKGLLTYFEALDSDIGRLVEAAGPETHVLFMSDHGFGPSPNRRFYVNVWLEQMGLLRPKQTRRLTDLNYWRMRIGRNPHLKAMLRRLLSTQTQDKLASTAKGGSDSKGIDWAMTQAYFVPIYFYVCGIELNTLEQHREGIVAAGTDYEALREKIIQAADTVRDPFTGEKIVQQAFRRETVFAGPYVKDFPDIILVLNPDYVGLQSLAGTQLVEKHVPFRPGEHRPDGIFLAYGPDIVAQPELPDLQLADVSATILYLLGVPVPDSFDGRVLSEIVAPAFWQAHPLQRQTLAEREKSPEQAASYSVEDEAELEERLRGLGYLE